MEQAVIELSQVIASFHASTNNEEKTILERQLVAWRQNPEAIGVSVTVISNPKSPMATELFCLMTLIEQLREYGLLLRVHEIPAEAIMDTCIQRLRAGIESEPVKAHMILCTAVCAFYDRRLVDKGLELDMDTQLAFLDYFLHERVTPNTNERIKRLKCENPHANIATNELLDEQRAIRLEELLAVLNATELSKNWLALHTSAFSCGSLSAFSSCLPKLQTVIDTFSFDYGGELMTLYESILMSSPSSSSEADMVYIKNVIEIMMTLEAKIMRECENVEQAAPYAFVILKETLDYGMDFFGIPQFVEFSESVFVEVATELQVFLGCDQEEFYALFEQIADTLAYNPEESRFDQSNWIVTFVHFVNELVNAGRFELCDSRMKVIVNKFTATRDKKLIQYIVGCIGQLKPGILYIIACNDDPDEDEDDQSQSVQKVLVKLVTDKLVTMAPEEIPVTVLYFIRKCAKYAIEHSELFLNLAYFWMAQGDPLGLVPKVLLKLSMLSPQTFVGSDDKYIQILIHMIEKSDIKVASALFAVLFTVIPFAVTARESFVGQLEMIGRLFISFFPAQINNHEDLNHFCQFLHPSLSRTPPIECLPPVVAEFYSQLFMKIKDVIGPLWDMVNEIVQSALCELTINALRNRWILSHEPVIEWVCRMLQLQPMVYHCHVIAYLSEDLPIPLITEFFNSMPKLDDKLVCVQLEVIKRICQVRPELVKAMLPLDVLLYPIASRRPEIFRPGVAVLNQAFISHVSFAPEELVTIVKVVTDSIFFAPDPDRVFTLLQRIGKTIPEIGIANIRSCMLASLQSLLGPDIQNQPPVQKLMEMFEVDSPNRFTVDGCLQEIFAMLPK